jgi:hypothetical protein
MPTDQWQTVTLILADGSRATYTGQYQLTDRAVSVVRIEASPPLDMPEGCSWGTLAADCKKE